MSLSKRIAKKSPGWGAWVDKGVVAPNGARAPNGVHAVLLNRDAGYIVQVSTVATPDGEVDHLWIRRIDAAPIRSWTDMQRIKNECVFRGHSRIAVEVYPPQSSVVDDANMYHLWVYPAGFTLPFGLGRGEWT